MATASEFTTDLASPRERKDVLEDILPNQGEWTGITAPNPAAQVP
jgi:hypothetical protein